MQSLVDTLIMRTDKGGSVESFPLTYETNLGRRCNELHLDLNLTLNTAVADIVVLESVIHITGTRSKSSTNIGMR